jgi:transglutaminase-like putative cysteine protease
VVGVTGKRRLGLVAAAATLLAAAPLSAIFDRWTWLLESVLVVGVVCGVATAARSLRAPVWAQLLAMIGGLLLALTWIYPSGDELLGILPTTKTFGNFGALMNEAAVDTRSYGVPVPDRKGLLFLAVLGVGSVGILVDLLTVTMRRPALAGLPMLAIYSVPVAVYIDSVPVMPFAIGATGFLWLLVADNVDRVRRFGRRFTGDGRDVDVWEPSPLAAAGRRLAVLGVAAAILLPLAVPGLSTSLLSRFTETGGFGPGNGTGPGGSGSVDLSANLVGSLNQNRSFEMVSVKTTEKDPFYLRFGVADVINENGFDDQPSRGQQVERGIPQSKAATGPGVNQRTYKASIEITREFAMPAAPVYTELKSTDDFNAAWLYDADTQVLFSRQENSRGRKYEFEYTRTQFTEAALRTAKPLADNDPVRRRNVAVPTVPEVVERVAELTRDDRTDFDKVKSIYEFFSAKNGFQYRLSTEKATGGSQIAAFLQSRVGFCQQYAAAMAWMVREAGIPARVAFGFTRGVPRPDGSLVMTNQNLHAWTEVYFQGFGWVPFDATPANGVAGSVRSDWAPDVDRTIAPSASASAGPSGSAAAPAAPTAGPDALDRDVDLGAPGAGGGTTPTGPSWQMMTAVGGATLLVGLLAVPTVLRRLTRRRRHAATLREPAVSSTPGAPGDPQVVVTPGDPGRARRDAHAAWDELVDTMVDYQVPVDPTETPRVTAGRLVRDVTLVGPAAEAAALLGRAEERARYARQPLVGGELTAALHQVRRGLAGGAGRRVRLRAAVLPPSVLMRWRLILADTMENTVARLGRGRISMLRFSPRRLLANRAKG